MVAPIEIFFRSPSRMSLEVADEAIHRTGKQLADLIRRRIKSGKDGDSSSLPPGVTLDRTGELLSSIEYNRRTRTVAPDYTSRRDVSARARNNFGLMKILVSRKDKRRRTVKPDMDPMGSRSSRQRKAAAELLIRNMGRRGMSPKIRQAVFKEFKVL